MDKYLQHQQEQQNAPPRDMVAEQHEHLNSKKLRWMETIYLKHGMPQV